MFRRLVLLALLTLPYAFAHAQDQYARYNGSCQQGGARAVTNGVQSSNKLQASFPACNVEVFNHGTLVHPACGLWQDAAGTIPLANPFSASSTGEASFYSCNGRVDVQYSGAGIVTPFSISDIQLCFNCTGGGGGGGTGTVTNVTVGDLPPLFTTTVLAPTTAPLISFNITTAAPAHKFFGNNLGAPGPPDFFSILTPDLPFTYSGNTTELATVTGALVAGNCIKSDASGNLVDNGAGCGGGGGGTPGSPTTSLQFNNGGSFAGTTFSNGTSVASYDTTTGNVYTPYFANERVVTPIWNWAQTDIAGSIGNLSVAGAGKTLNLAPCPAGVDTANFAAALYSVYISGVGTAEAVPVTGGTCISGAASGTIIVTTVNTHGAGFTVGSASTGIQEAINDGCRGGPTNYGVGSIGGNCQIELEPALKSASANFNYVVQAPIYMNSRAGRIVLNGNAAGLLCNTRATCLFVGNRNAASNYNVVQNVSLASNINIDGVQIADVTAAAGVYTVHTASAHPFSMTANAGGPDYVDLWFFVSEAGGTHFQNHVVALLTSVADNTHFTFSLGSNTFPNATGFGFAGLLNTMIEDNSDGTVMRDIKYFWDTVRMAHYVITVDNDQAATIDHFVNSAAGVRCTTNFCGALLFSRGDQGNSSIIFLKNSELSLQCHGNGIIGLGGNGLYISDSVIQGFSQFGLYTVNALHQTSIKDVHFESALSCTNPLYSVLGVTTSAIFDGGVNTYTGTAPFPDGSFPKFVTGGTVPNQRNYFVVGHSSTVGVTIPVPVGFAQPTNGAVTIPVSWPAFIASPNLGTVTYDVLVTIGGSSQVPLTGTGSWAIATGISGTCGTNGMCSFSDTQAAASSYTVAGEQWYPGFWYMPGGAVLSNTTAVAGSNGGALSMDSVPSGRITTWSKKMPTVFGKHWEPASFGSAGSNGMVGALVAEVYGTSATGPGSFSLFLNQRDPGNNGPPANSKGRLNFGPFVNLLPNHLVTWGDTNFDKTGSTAGMRPSNDATDCFTGEDQLNGLSFGCNVSISNYIANNGDGTNWKERLTSAGKFFATPTSITVTSGVGLTVSANGTNDTAISIPSGHGNILFNRLISTTANAPTTGLSIGLGPSDRISYGCIACSVSPITGSATNQNLAQGNGSTGPANIADYLGAVFVGPISSTVTTGTAPFVVASTTNVANLNASSLNGATFAAPGTIGGTTPGAATFTSVTATSYASNASNGGISGTEGTGAGVPAGANLDTLWPDSTAHRWMMNNNNEATSERVAGTYASGNVTTAGTVVNAGTCQAQTGITITGALTTDNVVANIGAALPATWQTGIVLSAHVTAGATVTVYLCNPTAGNITPAATQVNVRIVR